LFIRSGTASDQIEEAKLSHANIPRSESRSFESDLRGGWKGEFFEVPWFQAENNQMTHSNSEKRLCNVIPLTERLNRRPDLYQSAVRPGGGPYFN
jgi:hypothetical protein